MIFTEELMKLRDEEYGDFQANLTPTMKRERILGVRVPVLRAFAKECLKNPEKCEAFLQELPHPYYDEDMLHGILVSATKDFATCLGQVEAFLPYVDNWAVCDTMSPKVFKKNKEALLVRIREWIKSPQVYICRFGMGMLMRHFLDADFKEEYLELVAAVVSEEYYVNMMSAWFFATALAKQWDATLPYITEGRLPVWVHNKTIQKAVESYRITPEQKELLKQYRKKK